MRVRSLAPLRQLVAPRPLAARPLQARLLHSSRPALASEAPSNPLEDAEISALREKMKEYPGAVDAILKVSRVLEKKGFDMTKPPTTVQMTKMALDKEFRAVMIEMGREIQKAGLDPQKMMEMVEEAAKLSKKAAEKLGKASESTSSRS